MEEWKTYTASDFCIKVTDGTHDSPKPKDSGHYLITSKHLKDNCIDFSLAYRISEEDYQKIIKRSNVVQHDILFSMIGTIGNIVRITAPIVDFAVKNMAIFKMGGNELKSKWLYYWLQSPSAKEYIASRLAGSTQAYLTLDSIRQYPISSPSEVEMKRIVDILQSIDDKIEINNRINHNLEMQAQALYKSWFVDFEPFRGGKFVDSELGLIPIGWDAKPLSSICHIEKKTINPQKYPTCLFTHYSIPAYDNSELPELQKGSDILSSKYIISDYTILFSKLNPRIKRIWNVYQSESNPICSTEFVVYKPMNIDTYPFLYSFITGDVFYNNIMSKVNGATGSHQRFHPEETLDILVPYHIDCYRLYSQLVLPIIQQIDENKRENHYFSSLRDSLLPKLMSGELKINDLTC